MRSAWWLARKCYFRWQHVGKKEMPPLTLSTAEDAAWLFFECPEH